MKLTPRKPPLLLATLLVTTAAANAFAQAPAQTVPACVVSTDPAVPEDQAVPQDPVAPQNPVVPPPAVILPPSQVEDRQVDLKFRKEAAPPGGLAQMKIYITEPKPISTGGVRFAFDEFDSIEGIALASSSGDGYGVAVVSGRSLALSFVSPSATFGVEPDYPILTVVGRVPAVAQVGSRLQFDIDGTGMFFFDPAGVPYETAFENGFLDVQRVVAIHDVLPGSRDLPAGSTVTILGSGFTKKTRIKFNEIDLAQVNFIDSGRIDVRLGEPAHMHGMRIRAEERTDAGTVRTTYFSYERTRPAARASASALLASIVPIFPKGTSSSVLLDVSADTAGVAIQNVEAATADVTIDLLGDDGHPVQTGYLTLPASQFMVLTLEEIFGGTLAASGTLRVSSPLVPIQAMGIASDGVTARPQPAKRTGEPLQAP